MLAATTAKSIYNAMVRGAGWMGVNIGTLVSCGGVIVPALTPLIGNLGFLGLSALATYVDDIRTNVARDARYYLQKLYHLFKFLFRPSTF